MTKEQTDRFPIEFRIKSPYKSNYTEDHSQPNQISNMEHFAKIVNGFTPLTIFAKSSILDV